MMRKLYISATAMFWLIVSCFWVASTRLPGELVAADAAPPVKTYRMEEVARHKTTADCWMIIGGSVYDLSAYLPQHPSDPALVLPWCGKDAMQAYQTKTKGRPHSPYADQMLAKYRIGKLGETR